VNFTPTIPGYHHLWWGCCDLRISPTIKMLWPYKKGIKGSMFIEFHRYSAAMRISDNPKLCVFHPPKSVNSNKHGDGFGAQECGGQPRGRAEVTILRRKAP
jgi:hypothetical protein